MLINPFLKKIFIYKSTNARIWKFITNYLLFINADSSGYHGLATEEFFQKYITHARNKSKKNTINKANK